MYIVICIILSPNVIGKFNVVAFWPQNICPAAANVLN